MPERFRLYPKTPRTITHDAGVPLDRAVDAMHEFLGMISHLRERLTVWGFFNNDYAGYAVATCRQFMAGRPAV